MPEKRIEPPQAGPVQGETPDGEKGVVMLGRQIGGPGAPAVQLTILVPTRGRLSLDLKPESAAILHAQLGAMLDIVAAENGQMLKH